MLLLVLDVQMPLNRWGDARSADEFSPQYSARWYVHGLRSELVFSVGFPCLFFVPRVVCMGILRQSAARSSSCRRAGAALSLQHILSDAAVFSHLVAFLPTNADARALLIGGLCCTLPQRGDQRQCHKNQASRTTHQGLGTTQERQALLENPKLKETCDAGTTASNGDPSTAENESRAQCLRSAATHVAHAVVSATEVAFAGTGEGIAVAAVAAGPTEASAGGRSTATCASDPLGASTGAAIQLQSAGFPAAATAWRLPPAAIAACYREFCCRYVSKQRVCRMVLNQKQRLRRQQQRYSSRLSLQPEGHHWDQRMPLEQEQQGEGNHREESQQQQKQGLQEDEQQQLKKLQETWHAQNQIAEHCKGGNLGQALLSSQHEQQDNGSVAAVIAACAAAAEEEVVWAVWWRRKYFKLVHRRFCDYCGECLLRDTPFFIRQLYKRILSSHSRPGSNTVQEPLYGSNNCSSSRIYPPTITSPPDDDEVESAHVALEHARNELETDTSSSSSGSNNRSTEREPDGRDEDARVADSNNEVVEVGSAPTSLENSVGTATAATAGDTMSHTGEGECTVTTATAATTTTAISAAITEEESDSPPSTPAFVANTVAANIQNYLQAIAAQSVLLCDSCRRHLVPRRDLLPALQRIGKDLIFLQQHYHLPYTTTKTHYCSPCSGKGYVIRCSKSGAPSDHVHPGSSSNSNNNSNSRYAETTTCRRNEGAKRRPSKERKRRRRGKRRGDGLWSEDPIMISTSDTQEDDTSQEEGLDSPATSVSTTPRGGGGEGDHKVSPQMCAPTENTASSFYQTDEGAASIIMECDTWDGMKLGGLWGTALKLEVAQRMHGELLRQVHLLIGELLEQRVHKWGMGVSEILQRVIDQAANERAQSFFIRSYTCCVRHDKTPLYPTSRLDTIATTESEYGTSESSIDFYLRNLLGNDYRRSRSSSSSLHYSGGNSSNDMSAMNGKERKSGQIIENYASSCDGIIFFDDTVVKSLSAVVACCFKRLVIAVFGGTLLLLQLQHRSSGEGPDMLGHMKVLYISKAPLHLTEPRPYCGEDDDDGDVYSSPAGATTVPREKYMSGRPIMTAASLYRKSADFIFIMERYARLLGHSDWGLLQNLYAERFATAGEDSHMPETHRAEEASTPVAADFAPGHAADIPASAAAASAAAVAARRAAPDAAGAPVVALIACARCLSTAALKERNGSQAQQQPSSQETEKKQWELGEPTNDGDELYASDVRCAECDWELLMAWRVLSVLHRLLYQKPKGERWQALTVSHQSLYLRYVIHNLYMLVRNAEPHNTTKWLLRTAAAAAEEAAERGHVGPVSSGTAASEPGVGTPAAGATSPAAPANMECAPIADKATTEGQE